MVVTGRDAADVPVDVASDLAELEVTRSDRPASVSGTIQAANGEAAQAWVSVFPTSRAFWMPHARRIAATRSLADGTYRIGNLPVGEYLVAVVADAVRDEWYDAAFLDRIASAGPLRVALADGEQKTQSFRLR